MSNDIWREDRKALNRGMRWGLLWTIIIIVVVAIIGAIIWGINVAASGPKGVGDGIIQKNSAENWIAAQAKFEAQYADIVATDTKIELAKANLDTDPSDKTLQTQYTGLVSYCLSVAAEYNADARSYLSEEFRAADLPSQIDSTNPSTNCKE